MKYVLNATIADIQDINQLAEVLIDLCKEPPSQRVQEQINKCSKRIKTITNKYK